MGKFNSKIWCVPKKHQPKQTKTNKHAQGEKILEETSATDGIGFIYLTHKKVLRWISKTPGLQGTLYRNGKCYKRGMGSPRQ